MKTALLLSLAAVSLAACSTVRAPADLPSSAWTMQASATSGAALALGGGGPELLRLACRRNPADLYIASEAMPRALGPVRLKIGAHRFELTPDRTAGHLVATAPLPTDLPAALMSGGRIDVDTSVMDLHGLPAPDAKTAAAFAIACGGPR